MVGSRKDASSGDKDYRNELRKLTRDIEALETEIAGHEQTVSTLSARLEDPSLYTKQGGVEESVEIGKQLEAGRVGELLDPAGVRLSGTSCHGDYQRTHQ